MTARHELAAARLSIKGLVALEINYLVESKNVSKSPVNYDGD